MRRFSTLWTLRMVSERSSNRASSLEEILERLRRKESPLLIEIVKRQSNKRNLLNKTTWKVTRF